MPNNPQSPAELLNQATGAVLGNLINPIYIQQAGDFYKSNGANNGQQFISDLADKSRFAAHTLAVYTPDISRYDSFASRIWILLVRGITSAISTILKIFGAQEVGTRRLIDSPISKTQEGILFSHFTVGEAVSAGVVCVMIIWALRKIIRWLRGVVNSVLGEEYDVSNIILETINESNDSLQKYYNSGMLNENYNNIENTNDWFTKEKLEIVKELSEYIDESEMEIASPSDDSNLSAIEKIKLWVKRNETFTKYLSYITTAALFGFILFYYKSK